MSKTNAFETAVLENWFRNQNIATVGDATGIRGSSADGSLYMSLHTSDPGEAGNQNTNEIGYTSYARVAISRTNGFTVSSNAAALAADVTFPAGTGGTGTATHWGLGVSSSGGNLLLFKGAISPTIACGAGVTPKLTAGTVVTED